MKKMNRSKKRNILLIVSLILISLPIIIFFYYTNKPIFSYNYIEDDFEDQIIGLFPMGWLSVVNPFNVKVVSDNGNKVMEVKDTHSKDVTEIVRRFKKTSEGYIECKVEPLDVQSGFVIHIPQTDREYNPFDDIIIVFSKGEIYVIGEDNILTLENTDPSIFDLLMPDHDEVWLIDEWTLDNYDSVMSYEANIWYLIRIDFNREYFTLVINDDRLGVFDYPKYNPPYFASLYFWSLITPRDFKFYVDDVKITLSQPVDYIHPANLILLLLIPIVFIVFYYLHKKKRYK
ncbi:MAG: hypothetical protein ACFFDF_01015 [Candidatus Odinarchaeota archaeon]